jgi:hypothetical protein
MHSRLSLSATLVAASLFVAAPLLAQSTHHGSASKNESAAQSGQLIRVTDKDAKWAAKERASYPLEVCVSSDEKLGSMGKPPEYIYRVAGQPDRLVVFCCAGCDEDFLKDPARHLAKIDAAKASKRK